jgi:hypothetical protein
MHLEPSAWVCLKIPSFSPSLGFFQKNKWILEFAFEKSAIGSDQFSNTVIQVTLEDPNVFCAIWPHQFTAACLDPILEFTFIPSPISQTQLATSIRQILVETSNIP